MSLIDTLKKYILPILLLVIVGLVLASYFFVWPKYEDYKKAKQELDLKDEETLAKENYLPKLEAISERLADFSEQIENVEKALPSKPSIASLYEYFKKVTSENGLILANMDALGLYAEAEVEEGGEETGITEMLFSVKVMGSYDSFKSLLSELYLNERIIDVQSIGLSLGGDADLETPVVPTSSSGILIFDLHLKTQSYNESYIVNNAGGMPMEMPSLDQ